MANTLKIKRGTAATIPQGQLAEPLFTTDTYDLYIGKGSGGNQRIQNYIASGTSSQFLKGDGSLDSTSYQTALTFSSPLVNTSGTISIPAATGSVNGYLTSTDWTTFNSKEPAITAGTSAQYYRGDKTFQTLDTAAVPENGAIYFTEPRVRATVLTGLNLSGGGTIAATDSVLTAFGKVQNQISALVGGATYQGTWNASTNTPTLASGTGTKGYYYVVSVAGSTNLDGITDWKVGDWAIFNGTTWDKVDNTDAVSSVNGFTGAVNLALDNISDVSAASPTNAQLLRFNGTSSLWENWTPTFEPALTKGNLTEATSSVLTITGGTGAVIGSGTTIQVNSASASQNGVVTTGTQTFAGAKTFQVSGSGGTDLVRFYNDTDSKSLYVYSDSQGIGIANGASFAGESIYLYPSGNHIEFTTNGNPRARIVNTGLEVGYTSTQGTYKLDVNGTGRFKDVLYVGTSGNSTGQTNITGSNAAILQLYDGASTNTIQSFNAVSFTILNSLSGVNTSLMDYDYTTKNLIFQTNGNNTRLTISSSGTVKLNNYTTNGFVKFSNSDGTLSVDTNTYLTTSTAASTYLALSGGTLTGNITAPAFIPNGSTIPTNGMYLSAANTLAFSTNSTNAIKIDSSQRVGIGTDPISIARLYVNGDIQNTNGGLTISGTISAGSTISTSLNAIIGTDIAAQRFIPTGTTIPTVGMYLVSGTSSLNGVLGFSTGTTSRMVIDTSGNVGIGVAPSSWYTGYTALNIGYSGAIWSNKTSSDTNTTMVGNNAYLNSGATNWIYQNNGFATRYTQVSGEHQFYSAASGTAGNAITWGTAKLTIASTGAATFSSSVTATNYFSTAATTSYAYSYYANTGAAMYLGIERSTGQGLFTGSSAYATVFGSSNSTNLQFGTNGIIRATIDTTGNVGIGTSTPSSLLHLFSSTTGVSHRIESTATNGEPSVNFYGKNSSGTVRSFAIKYDNSDIVRFGTSDAIPIRFETSDTERMRITSGGYLKASSNSTYVDVVGSYHELRGNGSNGYELIVSNVNTTPASQYVISSRFSSSTPNNTSARFLDCEDSTATRAYIRSNGGFSNYQANDTNLSDIRTKKDIVSLESYWDKFKALEIVKFKYNDQTHDDYNIGLIAQQVENVAPEFVDVDGWGETPEDGVPYKSVYTADLHHATIKVLQEAMAKIEEQQAQIEELKSKLN